jgi:alkanesulfonate monooxygenase SsuD/methylene tetrahydromethanopterin reductase-like flavin-dependent oxidoreductase (luciferase family)
MQFGIFYEHQLPRPWREGSELRLVQEALDQVELADRLGLDYAWEVEHHFLEEYSHSSAPEVFLAAASQRTRRIRLGHGIVLMPPAYNHPARVAERIAMLDLVSNGRVEFGTGESASRMELEGFGIDPTQKRAMWQEAVGQVALMLSQSPYPGHRGPHFTMPPRDVLPKPVQKPHPPMWLACSSRPMIHLAAQLGLGALTFAFVDVAEAKHWVRDYYETFKRDCTPIAQTVNPNIAMVTGFSCHRDRAEAERRGLEGFQFFGFALAHYYLLGGHVPGPDPDARRECRHRHARRGARRDARVRRGGRRSGDLHPAGRQQPPRPHLRGARALRRPGDAGVRGATRRPPAAEGRGPGAVRRARARATDDAAGAAGPPGRAGVRPEPRGRRDDVSYARPLGRLHAALACRAGFAGRGTAAARVSAARPETWSRVESRLRPRDAGGRAPGGAARGAPPPR